MVKFFIREYNTIHALMIAFVVGSGVNAISDGNLISIGLCCTSLGIIVGSLTATHSHAKHTALMLDSIREQMIQEAMEEALRRLAGGIIQIHMVSPLTQPGDDDEPPKMKH